MANEESSYLSFLLRLWLADDDEEPTRRISLESPLTGECKGFSNLNDMCSYLRVLTKSDSEDSHNETGLF